MSNLENSSKLENINNFDNFIKISPDLFENKYKIININGQYKLDKKNESSLLDYIRIFMNDILKDKKQIVVYVYLEGYKTKNMRMGFIQKLSNVLQNEYPDMLYKCFIVKAPSYFSIVYKLISIMMDKETKAKIIFQNCQPMDDINI